MTHAQRATPRAGTISGRMMKCPYSDMNTNTRSAMPCMMARTFVARSRNSLVSGAFNAIHEAPAQQNMARPSKPHSSVKGVIRPISGMPL